MKWVILALWGWPGLLLAVLAGVDLLERAFHRTVTCSTRYKVIVAAVIFGVGIWSAPRGLPTPAAKPGQADVAGASSAAQQEESLHHNVDGLKQDLADQERSRRDSNPRK
jgi:hypothetical protein